MFEARERSMCAVRPLKVAFAGCCQGAVHVHRLRCVRALLHVSFQRAAVLLSLIMVSCPSPEIVCGPSPPWHVHRGPSPSLQPLGPRGA
eukprot:10520626-Alexandrium_andersonii.AAC.1